MRSNQLSPNVLDGLGIFALMARALRVPPPESETLGARGACANVDPGKAPVRRRSLLERLDHWFWVQQQREVEAYLGKATDVYDLEARIRALDRKAPYPF
jgi:Protein of unknown function (DUF3563)